MTFRKYTLTDYDWLEEDGTFTVYFSCDRKTLPTDLQIDDCGVTWNCYLTKIKLGNFWNSQHQRQQMYKCSYKRY